MFAESGVANGRMRTPFKKKTFFFLPFLPRWLGEEYRANARTHSERKAASSDFEQKYLYRYMYTYIQISIQNHCSQDFEPSESWHWLGIPHPANGAKKARKKTVFS